MNGHHPPGGITDPIPRWHPPTQPSGPFQFSSIQGIAGLKRQGERRRPIRQATLPATRYDDYSLPADYLQPQAVNPPKQNRVRSATLYDFEASSTFSEDDSEQSWLKRIQDHSSLSLCARRKDLKERTKKRAFSMSEAEATSEVHARCWSV